MKGTRMTVIDPETGLAKLPEGYFWRVIEGTYLERPIFYLQVVERREDMVTSLSWLNKEKSQVEVTETVIHEGYVWNTDVTFTYASEFATYLTPDRLERSSIKEYKKFTDQLSKNKETNLHREQSKALVGDYPPKRTTREETE